MMGKKREWIPENEIQCLNSMCPWWTMHDDVSYLECRNNCNLWRRHGELDLERMSIVANCVERKSFDALPEYLRRVVWETSYPIKVRGLEERGLEGQRRRFKEGKVYNDRPGPSKPDLRKWWE